ncbi:MAG: MFS transporter, partial [Gemmiger sp.]
FFLVGLSKGSALNVCTILVGDNVPERARGMNTMHSCYACGALLCPILITAAMQGGDMMPLVLLSALGAVMWLVFAVSPVDTNAEKSSSSRTDWSFLRSGRFWLLTALLFCQNGAETGVTGWLVTYFKDCGILSAQVSPYTVTVLWGVMMVMRLLLAFVFPPKNAYRAMVWMGLGCSVFYFGLIQAKSQSAALLLLAMFSLSIAGMNPTAVAAAGRMTSVTSMGVMLPVAGLGALVMPWLIGIVAEHTGIIAGMAVNLIPCIGMLIFALLVKHTAEKKTAAV